MSIISIEGPISVSTLFRIFSGYRLISTHRESHSIYYDGLFFYYRDCFFNLLKKLDSQLLKKLDCKVLCGY